MGKKRGKVAKCLLSMESEKRLLGAFDEEYEKLEKRGLIFYFFPASQIGKDVPIYQWSYFGILTEDESITDREIKKTLKKMVSKYKNGG